MANSFDDKYKANITGLAQANGVDMGQASAMLRSNLSGKTSYKGGGTLDYGQASRDLASSQTPSNGSVGFTDGAKPQAMDFDTEGMYNTSLKAKRALLESNYNTLLNTLKNNYDTQRAEYEGQTEKVNNNYGDTVKGINKQTYDDAEQAKVASVQRGVMNSEQGMAARQGAVRFGADAVNSATKQRNEMLNDLATKISSLTKTYGNDVATAQANYGLGNTQALNEALLAKQQADMSISQFNTGEANKFGLAENQFKYSKFLQDDQQNWQELQNNLDRNQQMAIAQLNASTQLKTAQISAGAQIQAARLASVDRRAAQAFVEKQWEYEKGVAESDKVKSDSMALLQQSQYYNPNAKVGMWDTMTPWDTKNEKAVQNMQQILNLSSAPQSVKDAYIQDMYKSYQGVGSYTYNPNWFSDMQKDLAKWFK